MPDPSKGTLRISALETPRSARTSMAQTLGELEDVIMSYGGKVADVIANLANINSEMSAFKLEVASELQKMSVSIEAQRSSSQLIPMPEWSDKDPRKYPQDALEQLKDDLMLSWQKLQDVVGAVESRVAKVEAKVQAVEWATVGEGCYADQNKAGTIGVTITERDEQAPMEKSGDFAFEQHKEIQEMSFQNAEDFVTKQTPHDACGVQEQLHEHQDLRSQLHRLSCEIHVIKKQMTNNLTIDDTSSRMPSGNELGNSKPLSPPSAKRFQSGLQTAESLPSGTTNVTEHSLRGALKMLNGSVTRSLERDAEYAWKASVWDAALFIFTKEIHSGVRSLTVLACGFLDVCFTVFALMMCRELVRDKGFNEKSRDEFNVWRTTIAHDVGLRDRVSGQSLARNVCDSNFAIPHSTLQLNAVSDIRHYIDERFFFPMGKVMCCLSLCIWWLTLLIEVRDIVSLAFAFSCVPVKRHTCFLPDLDDKSTYPKMQLVSVSVGRLTFIILLGLLRVVVVILLGMIGTQYLCSETSPENMLLNSVALHMILDFDELLYEALLPKMAQVAMDRIMPLTFSLEQKRITYFGDFIMRLSVVAGVLGATIVHILDPILEELDANEKALCGGVDSSLDFVMAVDSIGIPWAAATPKTSNSFKGYAQAAISYLKSNGFAQNQTKLAVTERSNIGHVMQIANGFALESLANTGQMFLYPKDWKVIGKEKSYGIVGWDEVGALKSTDFADVPDTVYSHYLNFLLGSSTGTKNCSHVPDGWCYAHGSDAEDVVMRQLCPSRCGCDLPDSGSVSTPFSVSSRFGFMGCSRINMQKPAFVSKLAELPCHDTNSSDVFGSWVQGVGNAPSLNSFYHLLSDHLMAIFQRGGCREVVKADIGTGTSISICDETSLPTICPESCGCVIGTQWVETHADRKDYCPYSCEVGRAPCMTIYLKHDIETGDRYLGAGYACKFPFKYEGQVYYKCTDADWVGPWCAITSRNDDQSVHYWGECPATC